jgi:hypothetical protein
MRELRATLSELAALDPAELSDLEVVESVRSAYRSDSMLASFTTALTGEADRRRLHRREGASSCSAWIGAQVRRPVGECREVVRRARRLGHMSLTAVAFARGQVAAAHVRHLIRARSTNPAAFGRDEELLVGYARTLRFDDFCRAVDYWCQLNDPDGVRGRRAGSRYHVPRRLHLSQTFDGMGVFDATVRTGGVRASSPPRWRASNASCGTPTGPTLKRAPRRGRRDRSRPVRAPDPQRRYDALIEMARRCQRPCPAGVAQAAAAGHRAGRPAPTLTGRMCELSTGVVLTPGEVLPNAVRRRPRTRRLRRSLPSPRRRRVPTVLHRRHPPRRGGPRWALHPPHLRPCPPTAATSTTSNASSTAGSPSQINRGGPPPHLRHHQPPRRRQDDPHREVPALRRAPSPARRGGEGPQAGRRSATSDWMEPRAAAGHLHHLHGAAVPLPRLRGQPARHPRAPRLLRGHLPGARRRRRRGDGARRRQGHRAPDPQAVRRLPPAQAAAAHLHQQVGPARARPLELLDEIESRSIWSHPGHLAGRHRRRLPGVIDRRDGAFTRFTRTGPRGHRGPRGAGRPRPGRRGGGRRVGVPPRRAVPARRGRRRPRREVVPGRRVHPDVLRVGAHQLRGAQAARRRGRPGPVPEPPARRGRRGPVRSTPPSRASCSRSRPTWTPPTATASPSSGCARAASSGAWSSPTAAPGKPFATKYAHQVFGQERETVDEAYPGDVVGLVNATDVRIGDTLWLDEPVTFPSIPSFAPSTSRSRACATPRFKQFRRGIAQLDEEGVVQVLRDPTSATRRRPWPRSGPCSSTWPCTASRTSSAQGRAEPHPLHASPAVPTPTASRCSRRCATSTCCARPTAPGWPCSCRPTGWPGSRPTTPSSRSSASSPRADRPLQAVSGLERDPVEAIDDGELLDGPRRRRVICAPADRGHERGDRPRVGDRRAARAPPPPAGRWRWSSRRRSRCPGRQQEVVARTGRSTPPTMLWRSRPLSSTASAVRSTRPPAGRHVWR